MNKIEKITNQSGRTYIEDNTLILEYIDGDYKKIPISSIKIVAEYTTENGPVLDDWFMVFYHGKNEYSEISMYAENIKEMISILSSKLDTELDSNLVSCTHFESHILWPIKLKGEKLWVIKNAKSKTFFEKFKNLFGLKKKELVLTKKVQVLLGF
ncbi:hypothetical protein [uncultured Lacinutrix sp.]|uniref:hypothetical protein n=1 Tax=uncultured Lacinutrix sp. TaxID=574032 RepID=UPI002631C120|nr:hypothetical protein [uncultured Lacinutrix sp.]